MWLFRQCFKVDEAQHLEKLKFSAAMVCITLQKHWRTVRRADICTFYLSFHIGLNLIKHTVVAHRMCTMSELRYFDPIFINLFCYQIPKTLFLET
jgi:hypothetical protein